MRTINGIELDDFTFHYLIAALWSSNDESDESGGNPIDDNFTIEDCSETMLKEAKDDCEKFQRENAKALEIAYTLYPYHPEAPTPQCSGGHDFWLTRNGHGVGFWDRGFPKILGDMLTEACKEYEELHVYIQDGKLYFE